MQLPDNFSTPHEELHHHFRNLCIAFRKVIETSEDTEKLQQSMEDFRDVAKQMDWHHKASGVYHREAGEKVTRKVRNEFDRYIITLDRGEETNRQDLLDALAEVERLIKEMLVT